MSRYNKPQDKTWKDILSHALMVVLATFIIVWFLPRGERSIMHFEVNKPWPYGQFIAPYDFPILKSEAEVKHERDSLRRLYEPYFELQPRIEQQQVDAFRTAYRAHFSGVLPGSYRTYIETHLHTVYKRGIIDPADLERLQRENQESIHIYHATEATSRQVSQLFTEKSAYEYIVNDAANYHLASQMLQRLDLNLYLKSNIIFDEIKSRTLWEDMEKTLAPSSGMVVAGQSIIDRGDIVTEETEQILNSFNHEQSMRDEGTTSSDFTILLGQTLYVLIIMLCMVGYLNLFRQDYVNDLRYVLLLLALGLSFPLMALFLVRHMLLSVYLIPFAMLPIFIRVFMDSRTAFFVHVGTVMLSAVALRYPFEFISTQLVAGLVAIYSLRDLSERSQIFRTAILVTLSLLVCYMSIDLLQGRTLFSDDVSQLADRRIYLHMIISGLLLLFAYPLMYLLERIFGFTSNVTLVELSNVNRELLRRLSQQAPGTFQHSMMVSNLAAEVANKIGAKAQLVRTGALYHDIGKLEDPEYFTENQLGGVNPHNFLTCKESAGIILRHVTDGLELADRYHLPRIIRDFIATHHGKGVAKYFYITQKNEHPDEPVNIEDYTYAGPNPSTTEQAILMMVDAVEASARSLSEYTEESIGTLVDKIIDGQMADGFFKDCPITFADVQTTKKVLKEKLVTIYHTRVSYPTLKAEAQPAHNTEEGTYYKGSTSK